MREKRKTVYKEDMFCLQNIRKQFVYFVTKLQTRSLFSSKHNVQLCVVNLI